VRLYSTSKNTLRLFPYHSDEHTNSVRNTWQSY